MSKSKEYKAIKNYIHNELGLTKEDIREIILPTIKEEVKRVFRNTYGNDADLENWVRCTVSNEIKQYNFSLIRNLVKEAITNQVINNLTIEIKEKNNE